jgi:hypothetical protein
VIRTIRLIVAILRDFRITAVAILLAITVITMASLTTFDLVKMDLAFIQHIEQREIDGLLSGGTLVVVALVTDLWRRRRRHQAELAAKEARTLRATMRTVQDIVNDFIDKVVRFELEQMGNVPPHCFDRLDELIRETYEKLKIVENPDYGQRVNLATTPGSGLAFVHNRNARTADEAER